MSTKQRWAFLARELDNPQACRAEDEFIAYPPIEEASLGVIVARNGEVSNRWGDGTKGVPDDVRQFADFEDMLYAPADLQEIIGWRDVEIDDTGRLLRIVS